MVFEMFPSCFSSQDLSYPYLLPKPNEYTKTFLAIKIGVKLDFYRKYLYKC